MRQCRSTAPLHSRSVRGDELKCRSSTPAFGSTTKLQHIPSKNHNFDPYDYLNNVPHHRVGQIHIAGHSKFEKYLLDTHDHPVLDPVWQMYAHAIKLVGSTATLLEWDDRIPSFDEVHNEALKANKFRDEQLATTTA